MQINKETVNKAFKLALYYLHHNYMTLGAESKDDNCNFDKLKNYCQKNKTDIISVNDLRRFVYQKSDKETVIDKLQEAEKNGVGTCIVSDKGKNKGQISGFKVA